MTTTTKFWTWGEIKAKVESELDLTEETFIDADEMMGYANDAVDEAESLIHTLYEDYFLTKAPITLVDGTDSYDLPSNIYAQKIRGIIYANGTRIYEVKRIREWRKFLKYRMARTYQTKTEDYRYFLVNDTAGSPQIVLSPPAYEDGEFLEIWFLRQANRFTADSDVCDIPEFVSYIFAYLSERVAFKEQAGGPKHQAAIGDLQGVRDNMQATLAQMVADNDTEIEADTTFYEDMV